MVYMIKITDLLHFYVSSPNSNFSITNILFGVLSVSLVKKGKLTILEY